jgi:hypothetical protein
MRVITADLPVLTAEDILLNPEKHDPWISPRHGRLNPAIHRSIKYFRDGWSKRGKFPGERRWIYAGAGRMRLARGGIFGPGMPRRAPMNS